MRAEKGNKVYKIDESTKSRYQNDGFDIIDDDGKIIAHGKGKTVPYEDYMKLQKENEQLKERVKELEAKPASAKTEEKTPKKAGE